MAFDPDRLILLVQPVGDGGMRWFNYQTDDAEATILGDGYFTNAARYGLRKYDLIFTSPKVGSVASHVYVVASINAAGHATAIRTEFEGDMLESIYDPDNIAGDVFDRSNHRGPVIWPVSSRAEMLALPTSLITRAYLSGEDKRDGFFDWNGGNLINSVCAGAITSSSVDSSTDTITITGHGLHQNMSVIATTAVNGVALNTIYYVIWIDADNFKLSSTFDGARAGTALNLTGTSQMTFRRHYDPTRGLWVTPANDISGASGAWVRNLGPTGVRTARMFGAVGGGDLDVVANTDAAPDDTPAIQAMFYSTRRSGTETKFRFDNDIHCVTMIELINLSRLQITFDGTTFYGRATTSTDAVIHLHNTSQMAVDGSLHIVTDGSRATPLYSTNYKSAFHMTARVDAANPETRWPIHTAPTANNFWSGLRISGFKYGIVSGNHVGEADHYREALDSNVFSGALIRSVMVPIYQKVENGGMHLIGCDLTCQRFSASTSWWVDADTIVVQNLVGRLNATNLLFQKAATTGYGFYGSNIYVHGCVYECAAPNRVTGRSVYHGINSGFVVGITTASVAVWQIEAGMSEYLTITNSEFRRILHAAQLSDTPPGTDVMFIDAKDAPDCRITLSNVTCWEFYFQPDSGSARRHFVRGGRLQMSNVELRNTSGFKSWRFSGSPRLQVTNADCEGDSMSTSADLTAKGGWTATTLTGGHFHKITSGVPTDKNAAIAIEGVGTAGYIGTDAGTSGFRVKANTDYFLPIRHKIISGSGYMYMQAQFYDFAGTSLGVATEVWRPQASSPAADSLTDWNWVNIPIKAPAGAHFGRLFIIVSSTAVRGGFTGI